MAEIRNDQIEIYYIPKNFAEEGKVFQGSIKVRSIIEGIVMALPFLILSVVLFKPLSLKILFNIFTSVPIFAFSLIGFNGDSLLTTLKNYRNWKKTGEIKIYDMNPTPFLSSPVDIIFSTEPTKDRLIGKIQERKDRKFNEKINRSLVEGEDYDLIPDPVVTRYAAPEEEEHEEDRPATVILLDDDDDI